MRGCNVSGQSAQHQPHQALLMTGKQGCGSCGQSQEGSQLTCPPEALVGHSFHCHVIRSVSLMQPAPSSEQCKVSHSKFPHHTLAASPTVCVRQSRRCWLATSWRWRP